MTSVDGHRWNVVYSAVFDEVLYAYNMHKELLEIKSYFYKLSKPREHNLKQTP